MPRLTTALTATAAALLLTQCSPKPTEPAAPEAAKPVDYSYDVAVTLTPAAAAKLAGHADKLTVETLYYGNVTPQTAAMADPADGTLHLNTDKVDVDPVSQTVHMTGAGVDPAKLPFITEKKPLALVNVYASHDGKKDGLIACSVFQDYVAVAREKPVAIACDLK